MTHELDKPNPRMTEGSIMQPRQNEAGIANLPRALCNLPQLLRPREFQIPCGAASIAPPYRVPVRFSSAQTPRPQKTTHDD